MRRSARLLGLSGLFAVAACAAQSGAAPPSAAPPSAFMGAPPEQQPDSPPPPSRDLDDSAISADERADILKILDLTLEPRLEEGLMLGFKQSMERDKSAGSDDPNRREMADAMLEMMREAVQEEFATGDAEFLRGAVRIYAANFSPGEVKDLLRFYQSPLGKKTIAAEAETQNALVIGQKTFANELLRKITAKMKEKSGRT